MIAITKATSKIALSKESLTPAAETILSRKRKNILTPLPPEMEKRPVISLFSGTEKKEKKVAHHRLLSLNLALQKGAGATAFPFSVGGGIGFEIQTRTTTPISVPWLDKGRAVRLRTLSRRREVEVSLFCFGGGKKKKEITGFVRFPRLAKKGKGD